MIAKLKTALTGTFIFGKGAQGAGKAAGEGFRRVLTGLGDGLKAIDPVKLLAVGGTFVMFAYGMTHLTKALIGLNEVQPESIVKFASTVATLTIAL